MSVPRCKFYLQGNCYYGTSCRFLHEERGNRPNNQYYDDYRPNNYRHGSQSNYENDHYERQNYQSGGRNDNYYSKKDYNYKNNYNQRNDYYEEDYSNNKYFDDNGSMNKYQSNKNYNAKNYYKDNDLNEGRNNASDHRYNKSNDYNNKNYQEKFTDNHYKSYQSNNRYNDSENQFNAKHYQVTSGDRERKLKVYENEIKTYQNHMKELIKSNIWPLTCCHPIGNAYPIQPVGCLNFIDVSFEEIRCDYYNMKSVCAIPEMVHNQTVGDVMKKAQKLKSDIVSLSDRVLDDLIATFEKCEESKTNNAFVNSIQVDNNSYWDMSIREFNKPKSAVSEIDSFSFVSKNDTNSQNVPKLKILLQNEVYGNMECEAFAQENFTDYIPIMPPPRKYCI